MKHLLPILFTAFLFSGELEVEGNLKVTGTVESTTIDSLKAVIAQLQAQLAAMQAGGGLQTRLFTIENILFEEGMGGNANKYSIQDITGYDLDFATIDIVRASRNNIMNAYNLRIYLGANGTGSYGTTFDINMENEDRVVYPRAFVYDDNVHDFIQFTLAWWAGSDSPPFHCTLYLFVTAEFPE